MIGKRVKVKKSASTRWGGETGLVTEKRNSSLWGVRMDGDDFNTPFRTDELIVLGGKHAGEPHPENYVDPPASRLWARVDVHDAEHHGKHAGPADRDAELDAWEAERAYL